MAERERKLYEHFSEKFEANLAGNRLLDAFAKTNKELGFIAYSSYNSYAVVRKRHKKPKK